MQCADRGAVELVEREAAAREDVGVGRVGRPPLQLTADTVAQLRTRLLGEGDRRDLPQFRSTGRDECDDPVDECGGLARAGARLDEQCVAEIAPDPFARGGVVE